MDFQKILLEKTGQVARIVLNVPEKRNPVSMEMREELRQAFERIGSDDTVKAVVIKGAGTAFSSGGDISTMEGLGAVSGRKRLKTGQSYLKAMLSLEKPVIAAVNGVAAGAGVSTVLGCDLAIASEKASFHISFSRIGLVPDMGIFYLLLLRIGMARAKELMFTGDRINADEAARIGMINRVTAPENLEGEALALAERLANGPSQAYAMIKSAMTLWPADLYTFLELEANMQAVAFESRDFAEGRRAFLEKRTPEFRGT
jgi:2-(1,2-epoxy-1,2-dihydrophenyl)acetyl-CoA isomerase